MGTGPAASLHGHCQGHYNIGYAGPTPAPPGMGGERGPDSQDWWVGAGGAKLPDREGRGWGSSKQSTLVRLQVLAGEQEPSPTNPGLTCGDGGGEQESCGELGAGVESTSLLLPAPPGLEGCHWRGGQISAEGLEPGLCEDPYSRTPVSEPEECLQTQWASRQQG